MRIVTPGSCGRMYASQVYLVLGDDTQSGAGMSRKRVSCRWRRNNQSGMQRSKDHGKTIEF